MDKKRGWTLTKLQETSKCYIQVVDGYIRASVSGGFRRPPPRRRFFRFHAVFGKIWQNRMFAPPPWELAPPGEILDPPLSAKTSDVQMFCWPLGSQHGLFFTERKRRYCFQRRVSVILFITVGMMPLGFWSHVPSKGLCSWGETGVVSSQEGM